ncbi:MAG TPA: urease accessory UreF family protein, partial [Myxococcaceae bacterium]|nr:urease accessory UreF family protein [Myxococcaceae bacterium]
LCMHLAPLWGVVFRALGLSLQETRTLHLWSSVRGVLSAGVRLGLAGTYEAQRTLADLGPTLDEVDSACAEIGLESLANPAPLLDLLHGTHDRLHSRLFQS